MRSKFWRTCWICFRWCRISLLLLILVAACVLLWCNEVGLPAFLKEPLLANLQQRGVQVEFQRMRLRMRRGIVAEQVQIGDPHNPDRPLLTLGEVQLLLDFESLLRGHPQVQGLVLREGRLVVPVNGTNQPPTVLAITNIQTDLRFQADDTWSLDNFQADFKGAKLAVSGDVAHASEIRKWATVRGPQTGGAEHWQTQAQQISAALTDLHLNPASRLTLNVEGDARNLQSFAIRLQVSAPDVQTPGFSARNLQLTANLTTPTGPLTNYPPWPGVWSNLQPYRLAWSARFTRLQAAGVSADTVTAHGSWRAPELAFDLRLQAPAVTNHARWFSADDFELRTRFSAQSTPGTDPPLAGIWSTLQPYRLAGSTRITRLQGEGVSADVVAATGSWQAPELAFELRLQAPEVTNETHRLAAEALQFNAQLTAPAGSVTNPLLPGIWSNLQPYRLAWTARSSQVAADTLRAETVNAGGWWRAPELAVTNLAVELGGGRLEAGLQFDATGQTLTFTNSSAFDPGVVATLLPEITRQRLALFSWTTPPSLHFGGTVDLSAWPPVAGGPAGPPPPVVVGGDFAFTNATVGGAALDRVGSHFSYSNQVWQVPDLLVERENSRLQFDGSEDEATKLFGVHVQGAFDVDQLRPWLKAPAAVREVGRLTFHQPLRLDVRVRGRLHDAETLAAEGQLALTNFVVRGGPVDSLTTGLSYSNRVFVFSHPRTWRKNGTQTLTADEIILDLNNYRIAFTNGFSTTEPQVVADSIGPKTGRTLEPYQFLAPPTARVNGYVSLRSSEDSAEMEEADLQVDVIQGAPFRWINFNSDRLQGTAHWFGGTLLLTNLDAECYGGQAVGTALFDFRPHNGTDYSFAFDVTNANLHRLLADLDSPTNKLEGTLGGRLVVTRGNSTDWRLMDGYGHASLHDGLIWDAPVFGLFSPVLNRIAPGLGSSRATDATARFTMTNGVVYSDSMEIHATRVRLLYVGTVDLWEKLDARVAAEPLRDTAGLGPVLNTVFFPFTRLFEYKVTGTLADPKSTPLYDITKLILFPLHPIKTLEDALPPFDNATNAPAGKPPK